MVRLIYHDPSDRNGVSPFDEVIRDITEDEDVLLTCPYIEPDYLREITEKTENWRLLTDVQAWLSIHARAKREEIHEFLIQNNESVRHVTDLHAKVIISDDCALIGSANFTRKGLTGRTEMSVVIDEQDQVDELKEWYERVWSIYQPPDTDKIEEYIHATSSKPSPARTSSDVSLSSEVAQGTASLSTTEEDSRETEPEPESHTKLVQRASKAPSPEWIDSYFDLLDDLISATGLSNDDPRLVVSLPQDGRIPVSINNRYVLVAMRRAGSAGRGEYRDSYTELVEEHTERATVGFILGADAESEYIDRADYYFPFYSFSDEKETDTPHYVEYIGAPNRMTSREFKRAWIKAACREIDRAEASPYKKYHEPVVYEAARNPEYRRHVLEEAFG